MAGHAPCGLLALHLVVWASGCVGKGSFVCQTDTQCGTGQCDPTANVCMFAAPDCASGWRYGEHAGALASQCRQGDGGQVDSDGGQGDGGEVDSDGGQGDGGVGPPGYQQVSSACAAAPLTASRVHYACDCGSDADSDCVAGDDGNTGSDAAHPYRSLARVLQTLRTMQAGEAVVLCKGGSFAIPSSGAQIYNFNCSAQSRCQLREYAPPWASGDERRPLLVAPAGGGPALPFEDPGLANRDQGYLVHNLELRGAGSGVALGFFNQVSDVDLCNLEIHDFNLAVGIRGANAPDTTGSEGPPGDASGRNAGVRLRGSYLHHNRETAWAGEGDDHTIEANLFDWNGMNGTPPDAVILVDGPSARIRMASNVLTHSGQPLAGICSAAIIVAHGRVSDLVIEDNIVRQDAGKSDQQCAGISVTDGGYGASFGQEIFERAIIRRNQILHVGNVSIEVGSCRDCVVESNLTVQGNAALGGRGIVASRMPGAEDATLDRLTVRSNTVVLAAHTDGSDGIVIGNQGSGHVLANNVVLGTSPNRLRCFVHGPAPSAYSADHNVCYTLTAAELFWSGGVSLAMFQATTGHDQHSRVVDPTFAPSTDGRYIPAPGSPLIDAAAPATSATTDVTGAPRGASPDIGAFERP